MNQDNSTRLVYFDLENKVTSLDDKIIPQDSLFFDLIQGKVKKSLV